MIFIVSICVILLVVLIIRNYLISRELKLITNKLKAINENSKNENLKMSLVNEQIEELCKAINKTLEARRICEADKKKSENKLRGAIADMSHDLRTPLTAIKGYINFLKDESLEESKRREYIEIIEKRSTTLEILLNDFYSLSLIDSFDFKLSLEKINIARMVQEVMFSRYVDFQNRGIEPKCSISENIFIAADKSAIERVIDNLITNAIKYSNDYINIELKCEGDFLLLEVENNSLNLEDCTSENIFNRFFMADKTRSGKGTGLGLSIAKELTEKMGGEINAHITDDIIAVNIKFKKLKV
ncbi:sensor histidine kinase [Clostridium felsineum]|uniref:histidine kinase n=1 Tax=Clostridium felsineum TaxID=36839 RepID=A0A1S8LPB3_9CLOT|nr:HAMP domain-containing sensor histidine kinase [Clostridium felsineum]MCR3759983.1 HAMP domain-containing histidine kinase [Clostridium felsineum]URZ01493.1 Sensor histidine kinase RcsC [Clostridium felsineum]URZ05660.1 Sensor histidine kinase RcsC [Clostridium felsineum]URZ10699.1 Sensor histidine kinase RcsC [Clostridium felsineum]